jgi:hypothetical protein
LIRKPEGKRPLGIPTCTMVDNIKMELTETGYEVVNRIHMAEDRIL